jgi:hypothetical protein
MTHDVRLSALAYNVDGEIVIVQRVINAQRDLGPAFHES